MLQAVERVTLPKALASLERSLLLAAFDKAPRLVAELLACLL